MFRVRYAPQLSRRFQPLDGGMFGDFGRFRSILGDSSVGTLPKHFWIPGSKLGMEHYLKSALALPVVSRRLVIFTKSHLTSGHITKLQLTRSYTH